MTIMPPRNLQAELSEAFDAVIKNPDYEHLRHNLADLLEENHQPEEAAIIRHGDRDWTRDRSDNDHLAAALWSSTDSNGNPLDNRYTVQDIPLQTKVEMLADWHRFQADHPDLIGDHNSRQAAHDFWMSRNGHGAGFFDADHLDYGGPANNRKLQDAARRYGEFYLEIPGMDDQEDDELPDLDDDNFDDRYNLSRRPMRYAAAERPRNLQAELSEAFKAFEANPEEHIAHNLADLLELHGRQDEAHFLRNHPEQSMIIRTGVLTGENKITPFHSLYYPVVHADNEDYDEPAQILDEHGPEAAIEYLSQWDTEPDNYRFREGQEEPMWGDRDYVAPSNVSRIDRAGGIVSNGRYHLYHNPRLGYIGLDYEHFEPNKNGVPDPAHTEPLMDSPRGSYREVKGFADAEVGVPHSIVPFGSDWIIHTAPEKQDQPEQYTRLRYAAAERPARDHMAEEQEMLNAIAENPDYEHLHHNYADLLDEMGRGGEAAWWRGEGQPVMMPRHWNGDEQLTPPGQVPDPPFRVHPPVTAMPNENWQYKVAHTNGDALSVLMTLTRPHVHQLKNDPRMPSWSGSNRGSFYMQKWFPTGVAQQVMKALDEQGFKNSTAKDVPIRHSAYRAPKGGTVVRGTFYVGGALLPDLEGDFANPPVPEAEQKPSSVLKYPQSAPASASLRQRIRRALAKQSSAFR